MNNATLNSATLDGLAYALNQPSNDLGCSISVSDYKWLTPKLKTVQQNLAVRPFYTCQIIDDSLVPNAILTSPNQPKQGSAVVAPDGKILSVGIDSLNNISFWKGDYTAIYSPATHIFTNGADVINALNHIAIQVSDFIAGTYYIDVYFFGNFTNANSSGGLSILHYASTDGGVTWSSSIGVNNTLTPYNQTANIWLAAGKPYQNNAGGIVSTVFYIEPINGGANFDIVYQQRPGAGSFGTAVHWSEKDVNTRDWVLHSLDVALINGTWRVAFSGYNTYYQATNQNVSILNYGIYLTEIVSFQNSATLDVWSPAIPIITSVSSSPQNENSFTFPQLFFDEIDENLYILFEGVTVFSITDVSNNSGVTTINNFYIAKSADYVNFSYPTPVIFTDGTQFVDTNANSILRVGQLFYIMGNGQLWNYILNNIVADVSADILSYTENDTQQSTSTLQLAIGNQNNQWRGASPTMNGYQAIAPNKKINLFQGYYTGDSTTEVVPKDIFYIDDIQANVSSNRNDFTLASRDFYKLLNVLQTKYTFNYTGIKRYVDIFDGTTMSNYNIVSGTWNEDPTTNVLNQTDVSATNAVAVFSFYQQTKANSIFTVATQLPPPASSGSAVDIYFYYIDENNYMRLRIANNGTSNYACTISQMVAGTPTNLQTPTIPAGSTNFFPFMFVRQSFKKVQIYYGTDASDGQAIDAFNTMNALGTEVDFTLLSFSQLGSVAFGGFNTTLVFQNFRYNEFDVSQNITELIQTIATKAGIFDYKMPTLFKDYFYTDTNYSGNYSLMNRILYVPNDGNAVMKNDMQISDIDISFIAQLSPLTPTNPYYFDFIFRNTGLSDTNNNYFVRVNNDGTGYITVSLYATYLGIQYLLASTGGSSGANNLRFDLTQEHTYRVLYFSSYIFVMIDGEVVFGWFDNNTTNMQVVGYIGFRSSTNNFTLVQNVVGIDLWTQIENFSINPGDDLESSIEALLNTIRAYFFSDLFGRFKAVVLRSTDTSDYTYNNQLVLQGVDNSDKEYFNEITVVGANGITATARDAASIGTNGIIRESVINDNTLTTYNDALARAQAELINANKFNNQYNPKQANNVGSEIYDVVHVTNTGANTSNVDQDVRNYSQETDVGGDNISYWLQIGTGLL